MYNLLYTAYYKVIKYYWMTIVMSEVTTYSNTVKNSWIVLQHIRTELYIARMTSLTFKVKHLLHVVHSKPKGL